MIDGSFMRPQFISALLLAALPMLAQLPAPNKAGVSAGHDVLRVKDMDAANKFWQAIGGQPVQFAGRLNLTEFPGVLLLNIGGGQGQRQAAPVTARPSGGIGWIGRIVAGFYRLFGEGSQRVACEMGGSGDQAAGGRIVEAGLLNVAGQDQGEDHRR